MTAAYDVVVVGGRVAGASTALLLAHAGVKVVLVDRDRRGSDIVSTHGLMRAGVLQLSRWGVLPDVIAAGTPPIRQVIFHYTDRQPVRVTLRPSAGVDALYAPRRHLDRPPARRRRGRRRGGATARDHGDSAVARPERTGRGRTCPGSARRHRQTYEPPSRSARTACAPLSPRKSPPQCSGRE